MSKVMEKPKHIPNNDDFECLARRVTQLRPQMEYVMRMHEGSKNGTVTKEQFAFAQLCFVYDIADIATDLRDLKG